jgi:hypothetical protein
LGAAGCGGGGGPSLAKVTGRVTLDGTPVEGAAVQFHLQAEKGTVPAAGTTDKDGKFTLNSAGRDGAPIGMCVVTVSKIAGGFKVDSSHPPTAEDMMRMGKAQATKDGDRSEAAKNQLPEKYNNPGTSGLTADVVKDGSKNVFEFPLKSE